MQLTDPEIQYSNETIKKDSLIEREHIIEISKTFEFPWIYSKRRIGWRLNFLAWHQKSKLKTC